MKITSIISLIVLFTLTMVSCQDATNTDKEPTAQIQRLFNNDNLSAQQFSISADVDTTITGKNGTVLTIGKNTFVDKNGNPISGTVNIELKECFDQLDMVLGNLTTTSNGQPLESGGMIYVNARSNDKELEIADDKSIGVVMPSDSVLEDMQLFEGVETDNGIDWQNPVSLNVDEDEAILDEVQEVNGENEWNADLRKTNVGYYVRDYNYIGDYKDRNFVPEFKPIPADLIWKIADVCWKGEGIVLTKDSIIQIDSFEVALIKLDELQEVDLGSFSRNLEPIEGQNQFREDTKTSYIFSIKKLGWANIDRLYADPRTEEIDLIVSVDKYAEFDDIFTSMIFTNQNMYLPGYQKKDKSFSFTHGDYEKTSLPVGETAIVLVTAYKDDQPYYSIESFTIKKKQNINMSLSATTKAELKTALQEKI